MSIYIGIDSGTQSTKAVALDLDTGRVIAEARAPHSLIAGLPPGHMEQRPQEWTEALDHVIAEVAEKIDRAQVRGIGVSGQQHGFVPLDEAGEVIRPVREADRFGFHRAQGLTKTGELNIPASPPVR